MTCLIAPPPAPRRHGMGADALKRVPTPSSNHLFIRTTTGMRKKQADATTIRLEQADREAIARIRELYGCPSDSAAIKLAVRMVARGPETLAPDKERAFYPRG